MSNDKRTNLEELLLIYQKNRDTLEKQIALHGARMNAPIKLLNEHDEISAKVDELLVALASILPDDAAHVDLSTRIGGLSNQPGRTVLDWTAAFEHDAPTADQWRNKITKDLHDLRDHLAGLQSSVIAVHPKAHITAAIAFGATFPTVARFQVWAEQRPDEWWSADIEPIAGQLLEEQTLVIAQDKPQISVEISVARDVSAGAEATIQILGLPVGRRIQLRTSEIPGNISNGREAKAMVSQVRKAILQARDRASIEARREPVHLFAAVPAALAVLIGAHLNTCSPVQCYEYRRDHGQDYVPACLV